MIRKERRGLLLGMLAAAERLAVARKTKLVLNFIAAVEKANGREAVEDVLWLVRTESGGLTLNL